MLHERMFIEITDSLDADEGKDGKNQSDGTASSGPPGTPQPPQSWRAGSASICAAIISCSRSGSFSSIL